jgi:hypothetical protein
MKKLFGIVIFFLCFQISSGQNISIIFYSPQQNAHALQFVTDSLFVQVAVISNYPLTTVTTNVSGRQISLIFNPVSGYYESSMPMLGLTQGTLTAQVTAIDNQGNQQMASQAFIYDIPAVLIVTAPLSYSTATPLVHIKAKCIDSSGCSLNVSGDVFSGFSGLNINTGDSVDSIVDLTAYNGIAGNISFAATDSRGQRTMFLAPIFVDTSQNLHQVFAANDQILDFNFNTLLVSNSWWAGSFNTMNDNNSYLSRSRIVNIITGDSTVIPYPGPLVPVPGHFGPSFLTTYGSIFTTVDANNLDSFYDWNANVLYPLGPANSASSLKVAFNNAIWSNDSVLYFRNLQTVANTIISSTAGNDNNDVASNGAVAYWSNDYNIYRFANSTSTLLTNNAGNKWNVFPLTDGKNIVYINQDPCCTTQSYSLHLYNGQTDSLLSNMGMTEPTPYVNYQLNNQYIAYSKPDSAGHLQIWLRDSLGTSTRVTSFAYDCKIDLLGPNGDLTFISQNSASASRRYFANRTTGQITDLCSSLGVTYFRDSTWYLALGRMLYKFKGSSVSIVPPAVTGLDSSYCQNQGLQKIFVMNLPDTNSGNFVHVMLDNAILSLASDSSCSFNVSNLTPGTHQIILSDSNAISNQTTIYFFNVINPATPHVTLSSNISIVTSIANPVILTATNAGGGGSAPLYTFASDPNFSKILQAEGTGNSLSLNTATLTVGANEIYVRMKTSDTCFTTQTAIDSAQIIRNSTIGITDPDFPNQIINVYPNPFSQSISIAGLNDGKIYVVIIYNIAGEKVFQQQINNKDNIVLSAGYLQIGNYWLSIYGYIKNNLIGTIPVLKE